ncbi:MAG: recombinase XerC [Rhodobacterales bacterium]|nr:MAG: recombinase XerC [Rhodobacterales bacterium]
MTSSAPITEDLREQLIEQPEVILNDHELMRALVAANERALGANVVDMRGIAMERLEARLDRLEETHRSVIAAAYENLAGMNLIHRAVLRMLDPRDFSLFMQDLDGEVAEILRVDCVRLVLETALSEEEEAVRKLGAVLVTVEPGFIDTYLGQSAPEARPVTLRQVQEQDSAIFGDSGYWIRSEATIRLDLGEGRLPGLLIMGAEDPHQFKPGQGTDLLAFFGGVFERSMRRWLS